MSRRLFAPEVVQTSAMDCGPAALKSVGEGFGMPLSYGRLREACQTSVDGTSIDTIEDTAIALGLRAEQRMVPVDHLLLPEAKALPAIVVTRLPSGLTHFVVVWRRVGPWVQVMDPGTGRHWTRADRFLRDVYVHEHPIGRGYWTRTMGGEDFVDPLLARLAAIGIGRAPARRLVDEARQDATGRAVAQLDAAVRVTTGLVSTKAIAAGGEAQRLLETLAGVEDPDVIVDTDRFVREDPEDADVVILRGAVVVRIAGLSAEVPDHLPPELEAAKAIPDRSPARALWDALAMDGLLIPTAWLAAMLLAAAGVTIEALLFRGLLDLRRTLSPGEPRIVAALVLVAFLVALVVLERPLESGLLRMGRRVEARLRVAFLYKLPRLSDRYFRSRLGSDMAERCHALAQVRHVPQLVGEGLRASFSIVFLALGLAWLVPSAAWLAAAAALLSVLLPLLVQPLMTEVDLRARTHSAALARFYLDALLGLIPVRTHGAQRSLHSEHEQQLGEWVRASLSLQRRAVAVQAVLGVTSLAMVVAIVFVGLRDTGDAGQVLLLVYWALRLPAEGTRLAVVAQRYPSLRNVVLRVCEPLAAPEDVAVDLGGVEGPAAHSADGVAVQLRGVEVQAGGHTILTDIDLEVAAGEHVVVVGRSGAGKSTLVGLLLGWHRPREGSITIDGEPLDSGLLARLRRETAWIDPDVSLWNRSLDANLRYGNDDHGALVDALDGADLRSLVERLPEGLQTPLGEGGCLVSGGEGQRVRTGRGLLRSRVRLALLDEPFRGLDRGQRRSLTGRIREHWRGATMIYVTHDIADTVDFDRVIVVEAGRIVEDGTPDALLSDPHSRYAALVEDERQARRELWSAARWTRLKVEAGRVVAAGEADR